MTLIYFDFPRGAELASVTESGSLYDTYQQYFIWGSDVLHAKAYKRGGFHFDPFDIIIDGKVEAKSEGGTRWMFQGSKVRFSYSSFKKARIWRCSEFGSLQIVNILDFSVIYLRGKEVGRCKATGGILSDYLKRRTYVKRCKERGLQAKQEPQNHFLELDADRLGHTLSTLILLHIYYHNIDIG